MPRKKKSAAAARHRLQLDVPMTVVDDIDRTSTKVGATSRGEVVRRAISLYVQAVASGGEVVLRPKNGKGEEKVLSLV